MCARNVFLEIHDFDLSPKTVKSHLPMPDFSYGLSQAIAESPIWATLTIFPPLSHLMELLLLSRFWNYLSMSSKKTPSNKLLLEKRKYLLLLKS